MTAADRSTDPDNYLAIDCPTCHVQAGQPCAGSGGGHLRRRADAQRLAFIAFTEARNARPEDASLAVAQADVVRLRNALSALVDAVCDPGLSWADMEQAIQHARDALGTGDGQP